MNLNTVAIKAFVPAKDFELSKRFYQALGFETVSEFGDVAFMRLEQCTFLLQDFHHPEHSSNFMMHLLVEDAASWHQKLTVLLDTPEFDLCQLTPLQQQPWGMLECCLHDPSGVLWRIAENRR